MKAIKILITGDSITNHNIYKGNVSFPGIESNAGTQIIEATGGAMLLNELVQHTCNDREQFSVQFQNDTTQEHNAYTVWSPCPGNRKSDDTSKDNPDRWRITEMLGYGPQLETSSKNKKISPRIQWDVVVINDEALGYRNNIKQYQSIFSKKKKQPLIVLKMAHRVGHGDLWAELRSGGLLKQTVLVVSADDLRRNEVMITSGRSWEQTIQDLLAEINNNIQLKQLMECRHVIISFGSEGALWIDNSVKSHRKYTIYFDASCLEGDWQNGFAGKVLGSTACFTAGIVCSLLDNFQSPDKLGNGISKGISGMRTLLCKGHGLAKHKPSFPYSEVSDALAGKAEDRFNGIALPDTSTLREKSWTLMERLSTKNEQPLYDRGRQVALNGVNILKGIPYGQFGSLCTVDRFELESLNGIRQLITHYGNHDKGTKPLSLGVFGPPGSGKSFGIKQIAKGILGDKVPILEFNLSQFDGHEKLIDALHQVRDIVLTGKIPVVFWDEFDSKDLYWLQYLLAPMQDGAFLQGQISHPIGKCIFIFAGGTSPSMEAFTPRKPAVSEINEAFTTFKKKKGPDFVSRLRGYLNVLGPNQKQTTNLETSEMELDITDICFPIRRALLLRAMSGIKSDGLLDIDTGLLNAFLKIGEFKHGARSLETIVNLTAGGEKGRLLRSNLPPREQISLHVDYDKFLELIQEDMAFQLQCEIIAPHIHNYYLELSKKNNWTINYDMAYEQLPPSIQEDNLAAARRLSQVLSLLPMKVVPVNTKKSKGPENIGKAIENKIELLAEAEHKGWLETKLESGWTLTKPGQKRSDKKKTHNCLVPYGNLTEEDKEKDRNSVRNYPEIVALAGYKIVYEK